VPMWGTAKQRKKQRAAASKITTENWESNDEVFNFLQLKIQEALKGHVKSIQQIDYTKVMVLSLDELIGGFWNADAEKELGGVDKYITLDEGWN